MGFSRQEYWCGLPFPSSVDHILSDLSTMAHPSWVVPHSMAYFHWVRQGCGPVIRLASCLWSWFQSLCPLMPSLSAYCLTCFEKSQRNQRSNCQHPLVHQKNKRVPELTMTKPLTVWITINCGKFWKRWDYLPTWPASWEICMWVRKQQLELDMEQQTGSNRKRSTSRLYIVTLFI